MQNKSIQLLMIEDNILDVEIIRELIVDQQWLSITIEHCGTLTDGIKRLQESHSPVDVAMLDLSLPDAKELQCFEQVHQAFPELPLIILSGNTDDSLALEAVQQGAQDYLVKGKFNISLLQSSIFNAIERQKLLLELKDKTQRLQDLSKQLEKSNQTLEQLATVDGLTQVSNRRRFDNVYLAEWKRLSRKQEPLSLIMCDVDYFKAYNDTYGHLQGDDALVQIARAIRRCLKRSTDLAARYGGEEFVVLLPETPLAGAVHIAEEIRRAVNALAIPHQQSPNCNCITLSQGVACISPNSQPIDPDILLQAADKALYQAKAKGRDRVAVDTSLEQS